MHHLLVYSCVITLLIYLQQTYPPAVPDRPLVIFPQPSTQATPQPAPQPAPQSSQSTQLTQQAMQQAALMSFQQSMQQPMQLPTPQSASQLPSPWDILAKQQRIHQEQKVLQEQALKVTQHQKVVCVTLHCRALSYLFITTTK
jgi:hypothetical protein